jgi:23S rRNA pseudouridine1911/1915/1917 synthase
MALDQNQASGLEILLENPDFFILNKPPGVSSSLDMGRSQSLMRLMHDQGISSFPGLVHRLDTPVSGLMLWAAGKASLACLSQLFAQGKIHKRYWLIVPQGLDGPSGEWEDWVWHDRRSNKSFVVPKDHKRAKSARLRYRVLSPGDRFDLVEVELITGRTHQIRVQFAHRGFPLRGDLKYGARRSRKGGGIGLFSRQLSFNYPPTGETIDVTCPLPEIGLWKALSP